MTWTFDIGRSLIISPGSGRSKVFRLCRLFRGHVIWVTFTPMRGHVVPLLEAAAADLARKPVAPLGVVFTHVPVQRGLLTAGETTHLTPEENTHTHTHENVWDTHFTPKRDRVWDLTTPKTHTSGVCKSDKHRESYIHSGAWKFV